MQYTLDQVNKIKALLARMKVCFILLMFMFITIYIYADKHQFDTPHNYWLGIIFSVSVISSLGYLFYMAKLVKNLSGNPIAWVLSTVIFGPFGLLFSYIVISSKVTRLQKQHIIDIEGNKTE